MYCTAVCLCHSGHDIQEEGGSVVLCGTWPYGRYTPCDGRAPPLSVCSKPGPAWFCIPAQRWQFYLADDVVARDVFVLCREP